MDGWKKQTKIIVSVLTVICLLGGQLLAQEEKPSYIKPGLLSATGTLSPAKLLSRNQMNYYLTGSIEGRISEFFSVKGEIHGLLGTSETHFLKNNIRSGLGINYGYPFGNLEVFAGFMPGFAFMKSNYDRDNLEFNPIVQVNAGVRYYVWKYFHFSANFNYVYSSMSNLYKVNGVADEFMISVGLGYNFQVLKKNRE